MFSIPRQKFGKVKVYQIRILQQNRWHIKNIFLFEQWNMTFFNLENTNNFWPICRWMIIFWVGFGTEHRILILQIISVLLHITHCWWFNAKSCFYIYIKMIWKHFVDTENWIIKQFDFQQLNLAYHLFVWLVGCFLFFAFFTAYQPFSSHLKTNHITLIKKKCFSLVCFYGISTIVDYLMPNPFLHI